MHNGAGELLMQRGPNHVCAEADDGFKHLQFHVVTNAFDSKDDVDLPKCHPDTRTAVLDEIIRWIFQTPGDAAKRILWLYGAAGAGKSAISRTIVERCIALGIPIASFFFFRTDATRNTLLSFVATLAHQLIRCFPALGPTVVARVQSEPLIFEQSLETQLKSLVFEPLELWLCEAALTHCPPVVLLIDGVDELCTDPSYFNTQYGTQAHLVRTLSTLVGAANARSAPVRVLFASRAESRIKQAFDHRAVAPLLYRLPLDDNYLPDADIARYLSDSLADIKDTHPCRHLLDDAWPPGAAVQDIVTRASGQFIYASLVVNFVSAASADPAHQLAVVLGLRPAPSAERGPFAQLDALYRALLAQVADIDMTTFVLAAIILGGTTNIATLVDMFPGTLSEGGVHALLGGLTAAVACEGGNVRFLHASLPDFLLDPARAGAFYIDRTVWATRVALAFTSNVFYLNYCYKLTDFLRYAELTPALEVRLTALFSSAPPMYPSEESRYSSSLFDLKYTHGNSAVADVCFSAFHPELCD